MADIRGRVLVGTAITTAIAAAGFVAVYPRDEREGAALFMLIIVGVNTVLLGALWLIRRWRHFRWPGVLSVLVVLQVSIPLILLGGFGLVLWLSTSGLIIAVFADSGPSGHPAVGDPEASELLR